MLADATPCPALFDTSHVSAGVAGNCGNGPSMVILPEGMMLRHVSTAKDVADILAWQCKVDIPDTLLKATEVGHSHDLPDATHAWCFERQPQLQRCNGT